MILTNEKINNRKNVMILGDILADVNMADNIDYDNLITIGFLNKPKNVLTTLITHFDPFFSLRRTWHAITPNMTW